MNGDFSFPKTNTFLLLINYKQNNKFIKGISGTTSVINKNDESALNQPSSMHILDVTRFRHFSIMASASFGTDGLTLRKKAC